MDMTEPMEFLVPGITVGRALGRERPTDNQPKSHIERLYSAETLKKLFAHALLIDMDSNNDKVDAIKEIVGEEWSELGPGTNRFGMLGPDGYCHKIALDRRGIVDNITEFKRGPELGWVSPRIYETNGVILVAESVELMTKEDFRANRANILQVLKELAPFYIMTDVGYAEKNFCNWGVRRNGDLVILDTGYIIPRLGNEEAMACPLCGRQLEYNANYTHFVCHPCNAQFDFIDVYRRLSNQLEDELFQDITGFTLPDFTQFNNALYNSSIMKGGHIRGEFGESNRIFGDDGGSVRYEDLRDILRAQNGT